MKKQTKVYDYNEEQVRDALLGAFKKRGREATIADIVTVTGLPKVQVEEQVAPIADEYGARLKVTESGEILYSFPEGYKSRYSGFGPGLKRFLKVFRKVAVTAGTWLFKAWIAVMLVGYFALFVGLTLVALLASIAGSVAGSKDSSSSRKGGSGLGFALTIRLINFFIRLWFYSELFKSGSERQRDFERKKNRRPLHKAVFSFVFGDGDPNADWAEVSRKAVIEFVQANKGIMTLPEFAAITGSSYADAERDITRFLVEFEGKPEVTEDGTIYFFFPSLMKRSDSERPVWDVKLPFRKTAAFSSNPKGMNGWFIVFNAVNFLFGGYFIAFSTGMANELIRQPIAIIYRVAYILSAEFLGIVPDVLLTVGLGIVPFAFAFLFYLIPGLRKLSLEKNNGKVGKDNLRAASWRTVLRQPEHVLPAAALEAVPSGAPAPVKAGKEINAGMAEAAISGIAAEMGGEPVPEPSGGFSYSFKELIRQAKDIGKVRAAVNSRDFEMGNVIFDSHAKGLN